MERTTRYETLKGAWMPGKLVDQRKDIIPPAPDGAVRMGASVTCSDGKTLVLHNAHPGCISVHYAVKGRGVVWDESELSLRQTMKRLGVRTAVRTLGSGERVAIQNEWYVRDSTDPFPAPAIDKMRTTAEQQDNWYQAWCAALAEMVAADGGGPVAVSASAGTDSLMVVRGLLDIGADVQMYCAGTSPEDFDPQWAARVAAVWGVPFTFVEVPTDTFELDALLHQTMEIIEQVSFSNVLMGMCSKRIVQRVAADGIRPVYTGYRADVLFGNKLDTVGDWNKLPPDQQTDEAWRDIRHRGTLKMVPYSHQTYKSFSDEGCMARSPFLHPGVIRQTLTLSERATPVRYGHKYFLEGILNRSLPEGARPWDARVKIGFYTGSGIGKIRRENPVLQDPNMRAALRAAKIAKGLK